MATRSVTKPGKLIFLSGQVANDPYGQLVGKGDLKAQTEQVFANLNTAQPPASTLVGVAALLQDDYLIAVDAIAVVPEKSAQQK
jgi:enamine deaminase RidA (YjgF/YER057c/UK114 family)